MNENKVAFIICSNNMVELNECEFYLKRLVVPEGIETEVIVIPDAVSMTCGYNQALRMSDAKYKVYMHHDTMILNKTFIKDIIKIFLEDNKIGILGVIGTNTHVASGVYFDVWNKGIAYMDCRPYFYGEPDKEKSGIHKVVAIDGMIMVTQYDIEWREDLFTGWDFYDISQSFEFLRKGYEVAVPYQAEAWCWHDMEIIKLQNYNKNCLIMKKNYQDIYPFDESLSYPFNKEVKETLDELEDLIMKLARKGERKQIYDILKQYYSIISSNLNLNLMSNICEIDQIEQKMKVRNLFWKNGMSAEILVAQLNQMKFAVKRADFIQDIELLEELVKSVKYSDMAWIAVIIIYVKNRKEVFEALGKIYRRNHMEQEEQRLKKYVTYLR